MKDIPRTISNTVFTKPLPSKEDQYFSWLEDKIDTCLEDKDLQREHWAFCQAMKKFRELFKKD